jgi:hypothetical protein
MSKKLNQLNQFITLLQELNKQFPAQPISNHLATAFSDYGKIQDLWGLSNKELVFALEKYQANMEIENFIPTHDSELEKIIEEGKNIDKINLYNDNEEEDDDLWQ